MEKELYNYKRVDKVNLLATWAIVILICGQLIISHGITGSAIALIAGTGVILISTVNYFIAINRYIKALTFSLLPASVDIVLFHIDGFAINKHYILITTIAITSLYFKKELLLIYGAFMNVALIAIYLIDGNGLLYSENTLFGFIKIITLFNGILVLLFFLTKWGYDLVIQAADKEKEARGLLAKLENTLKSVEEGAGLLDSSINSFDTQMKGISQGSQGILDSVQQMASAIQEEASSVYRINEFMSQSLEVVHKTVDISKNVINKADNMSKKVEDGWIKINEVTNQMNMVNDTIGNTADTVSELKDSLKEINKLLNSIKTIAGQTNLLALNASIESARAGEQGRGFAVVAEQIRKLSEQSRQIVADINEVTDDIFQKSDAAVQMSMEGEKAATEGINTIREVAAYFNDIKQSYKETNDELSRSMNDIASAANNFMVVQDQITNVASISEENSASTQEILSIIENENSQITSMNTSVSDIYDLSKKLKAMAKLA